MDKMRHGGWKLGLMVGLAVVISTASYADKKDDDAKKRIEQAKKTNTELEEAIADSNAKSLAAKRGEAKKRLETSKKIVASLKASSPVPTMRVWRENKGPQDFV